MPGLKFSAPPRNEESREASLRKRERVDPARPGLSARVGVFALVTFLTLPCAGGSISPTFLPELLPVVPADFGLGKSDVVAACFCFCDAAEEEEKTSPAVAGLALSRATRLLSGTAAPCNFTSMLGARVVLTLSPRWGRVNVCAAKAVATGVICCEGVEEVAESVGAMAVLVTCLS